MAKKKSTFEREMQNADFRKTFEREYNETLLSELVCAIMDDDKISVRKLAEAVEISPSVIQKIRSGQQKDVKVSNFISIMQECGYDLILEKGKQRIHLHA